MDCYHGSAWVLQFKRQKCDPAKQHEDTFCIVIKVRLTVAAFVSLHGNSSKFFSVLSSLFSSSLWCAPDSHNLLLDCTQWHQIHLNNNVRILHSKDYNGFLIQTQQWLTDWTLNAGGITHIQADTSDCPQPHKLIMQRRDTINSNQFIQASCRCQANSKCTDGDGARGYITEKSPSIWLTLWTTIGWRLRWQQSKQENLNLLVAVQEGMNPLLIT